MTISGGTFTAREHGYHQAESDTAKTTITGGNFTGTAKYGIAIYSGTYSISGSYSATGGIAGVYKYK